MLKPLKFKGDENKMFFVSDLHWNHDKDFIWSKRKHAVTGKQYTNVTESNEGIIESWNSVCDKDAIVFNCGDVVFADKDGSKFMELMRRLNFRQHYVMLGNHVSGHKQVYWEELRSQFPGAAANEQEVYPLYKMVDGNPDKLIVFLPQYAEVNINGKDIVLCHYPIVSHNSLGHGSYMICGHSHGSCEFTHKNATRGKRLDVGIESFGRPIILTEVKYLLKDRETDSPDHHSKNTT